MKQFSWDLGNRHSVIEFEMGAHCQKGIFASFTHHDVLTQTCFPFDLYFIFVLKASQ